MKEWQFFTMLLLGLMCVGLIAAVVGMTVVNQRLQQDLQAEQQQMLTTRQRLDGGILGAQGQQISASILQNMVGSAGQNAKIRRILEKYGYRVQPGGAAPAATNTPAALPTDAEKPVGKRDAASAKAGRSDTTE
jgi:type II secretory pathway pseudopilin PulG